MSSGFISEAALEERRRVRQAEWEKVRHPDQPLEAPEEEYDHRSLYERLQEQKQKRDLEYEEAHKLKNMIKGLDDDDVEFLDLVDRSKMEEEKRKNEEESKEMRDFRHAVANLQEQNLQERIKTEIKKPEAKKNDVGLSIGVKKNSQSQLLTRAVKRKASEALDGTDKKQNSASCDADGKDVKSASVEDVSCEEEGEHTPPSALQCVGILPGIGDYPSSSDSEKSSDTEEELPTGPCNFDLCGRKIVRVYKPTTS